MAEPLIHENVAPLITDAKAKIALVMAQPLTNATERNAFIDLALTSALAGRDLMVVVLPPLDTQAPSVMITTPGAGTPLFGQALVSARARPGT